MVSAKERKQQLLVGPKPVTVATPAVKPGPVGATAPVKLVPKPREYTAMQFTGLDNLVQIMKWLGNHFYALTDGEPISLPGVKEYVKTNKDDTTEPFTHLRLIVVDDVRSTYVIVAPGQWIIYDPLDGYATFTEEDLRDRFSFAE